MSALHPTVARIQALIDDAGIGAQIQILPSAVRTAQAAAAQLGCSVGAIANSLVFTADGAPLLVMTSGAHRVDEARLAQRLGAGSVRRARAQEVRAATGQAIGGVALIGHPRPLRTIVDPTLAEYAQIWAAAGVPASIVALTFDQLVQLTGGEVLPVN